MTRLDTPSLLADQLLAERYELPAPPADRPAVQARRRRALTATTDPVRATCPECNTDGLAVRDGRYAGQLPPHAPGRRSLPPGQARCPGSGQTATVEMRNR
jgi:hypothetical protein